MTERTVIGLASVVSPDQIRGSLSPSRHAIWTPAAKAIAAVGQRGYAFVPAKEIHALLVEEGAKDWIGFSASWDDLPIDAFMGDRGKYRRRRYAEFAVSRDEIVRKPHGPHYQSCAYNPLNGGIERWFGPIVETIASHPALRAIFRTSHRLFDSLTPTSARPPAWHVEAHQIRIIASSWEEGHPTPEGLHRDGVDWALMLLIARDRVRFGKTTICDLRGRPLGSFTLTTPFDAAFVNDRRVYHEVTPIAVIDKSGVGHRDMLVVKPASTAS